MCRGRATSTTPGNEFGLLDTYTPPEGYWTDASDGGIFTYGNAVFHGSMGGQHLNKPIVGMAATPGGGGYWEVASDGGIFSFGDAAFHGSTGSLRLNKPIVGMAATPDGGGLLAGGLRRRHLQLRRRRLLRLGGSHPPEQARRGHGGHARRARLLAGGLRRRHLQLRRRRVLRLDGGIQLNKPVVGMATSATGTATGSWPPTAASSATATPSSTARAGSLVLNKPIVGMMSTFDGAGYWLVASDGGIFSYGDAGF